MCGCLTSVCTLWLALSHTTLNDKTNIFVRRKKLIKSFGQALEEVFKLFFSDYINSVRTQDVTEVSVRMDSSARL